MTAMPRRLGMLLKSFRNVAISGTIVIFDGLMVCAEGPKIIVSASAIEIL
jgi:hypothetical protein